MKTGAIAKPRYPNLERCWEGDRLAKKGEFTEIATF